MCLFLGVDVGSTETRAVISDENGNVLGFGKSGAGNHQNVGYDGMLSVLQAALERALGPSGARIDQIQGAGYGISGYDWESQKAAMAATIVKLGIQAPFELVNDAIPGLIAGSPNGWGVAVISGTGCNCRGWDRGQKREGRVSGYGVLMGEAAGATELVQRAMQIVGYSWSKRLPPTALCEAFIEHVHAKDLEDLIEGYTQGSYRIGAETAPLVFQVARAGDEIARQVVTWGGCQLGEMANGVIRQLDFENIAFDVVYSGSMFAGGELLSKPMEETILKTAPKANLIHLTTPPVLGAVILGLEAGGLTATPRIRTRLVETFKSIQKKEKSPRT